MLVSAATLLVKSERTSPEAALTFQNLPADAQYARHPSEESEAKTAGKIVMRHYATPAAVKAGGPIYGLMGYRIVSIEYEISAAEMPTKTVGQEFSGYSLSLPEFRNTRYNHFHVSYQAEGLGHREREESRGGIYSIHFMLIPHEEELSFGLVCE